MKTKTLTAIAATLLALTACSSGGASNDTPGSNNTPGANPPGANPPGANDNPIAPGDFCGALEAWGASQNTTSDAQSAMDDALEGVTDPTDPAAVAAIQAWGVEMKANSDEAVADLQAAKASVNDPEVKAAIDTMISMYTDYTIPMAEAAISTNDIYSWAMAATMSLDTDSLDTLMTDASNAATVLSQYTYEHCSGS
jgi:hypothetical protein